MTTNNREDPPPYTPTPAFTAGETTLEHGPSRPYQSPTPAQSSAWPQLQHSNSTTPHPSLLRQLTNSFNNLVNQLDHPQQPPTQNTWPDHHQPSHRPPNHVDPNSSSHPPLPTSSSTSTFVRDFYAAGTGVQSGFAPPTGPPPTRQPESIPSSTPDDGRPTTHPVVGHPLLNDGKVLVYPKRYKCDKCDNIGYKEADPSRPCRRCWNKYARSFSGPLAYSFSSNSSDGNFQRPLPPPVQRSIFNPPGAFQGTSIPPQPTGFRPSPTIIHGVPPGRPTNAVVYTAGDPRIGGVLCWRCGGKGHLSFLFLDSFDCEVCNGIGRLFQ